MFSAKTIDSFHEKEQFADLSAATILSFKQVTKAYALFHILFFSIACLELAALILFFAVLTQSTIFAFTLAGLLFTSFTYFVLLFYFQAKKPQQLLEVRENFIERCKAVLPGSSDETHLQLAHLLHQLFLQLDREEYNYYPLSASLKTLHLLAKKFSIFAHWKDVYLFRELLLQAAIDEYIACIQIKPTDVKIHRGLATTFLSLARLNLDPRKTQKDAEHLWVCSQYSGAEMAQKFKKAARRAVEELLILNHYTPKDPWVYTQLANIYADLELTDKQICAYEALLCLAPENHDALFHLGTLYFSQGQSAQGLVLYEKLQQLNPAKAAALLSYYGSEGAQ